MEQLLPDAGGWIVQVAHRLRAVRGELVRKDRAEHGDAEGLENVARRVEQRTGAGQLRRLEAEQSGRQRCLQHEAQSNAAHGHNLHDFQERGIDGQVRQFPCVDCQQDAADEDEPASTEPVVEGARDGRDDARREGERQHEQTGLQGSLTAQALQVDGQQEFRAEEGYGTDPAHNIGEGIGALQEEAQIKQRLANAQLDNDEGEKGRATYSEQGQDTRRCPAVAAAALDGIEQRAEADGGEDDTGNVQLRRCAAHLLAQPETAQSDTGNADGYVYQENVAPVQVLHEVAAEYGAAGRRDDQRNTINAEGEAALAFRESAEKQ